MSDETPKKMYKLLGADGEFYWSEEKGTLGGNFIKKNDKIYGRLDCPAALRSLKNPNSTYPKYRVFFKDEATANAAGYRPCGTCMPEQYKEWKRQKEQQQRGEFNGDSSGKN